MALLHQSLHTNYIEHQHMLALLLCLLRTTTQSVSACWLYYSTHYVQLRRVSVPAGSTTPLATYNYTECQRLLALLLHSLRTTTQSVSACWLYYSTCYIQLHRVSTPAGSTTPLTTLHRVSAPAGSTISLTTYNYTECQRLLALLLHSLHTTTQSVSACWLYYSTCYIQLHRESVPAGSTTPLTTYNYTECQCLLALLLHLLHTTTQSISTCWLYYSTHYIQLHIASEPAGSTTPLTTYNYTERQCLLALLLHSLHTTTQSVSTCWLYYSTHYIQLHRASAPAGSTTPLTTYNYTEHQRLLALLLHLLHTTTQSISACWLYYSTHYIQLYRASAPAGSTTPLATHSVRACWLYYSTHYVQLRRVSVPTGSTTPLATYNYAECQRLLALLLHSLRTTTQSVSACWLYYSTHYVQLRRVSVPTGSTTPLATYNYTECQHLLALLLHSLRTTTQSVSACWLYYSTHYVQLRRVSAPAGSTTPLATYNYIECQHRLALLLHSLHYTECQRLLALLFHSLHTTTQSVSAC